MKEGKRKGRKETEALESGGKGRIFAVTDMKEGHVRHWGEGGVE